MNNKNTEYTRIKKIWQYIGVAMVASFFLTILQQTIDAKNTGFETKTLWDWMELLVIPLFLASGAYFLNRSERANEREIATDRQREAALQSYIDRMAELLLKENLRTTENEEVRNLARTRTLSVLRGLDGNRKGLLLQFLYEAELIQGEKPMIILKDADLSSADLIRALLVGANLSEANLSNANLSTAILHGAILREANLGNANLSMTHLSKSDLTFANLENANLRAAQLKEANLKFSELKGANLIYATLTDAQVSDEQLKAAKSLVGVTMPNGKQRK